MQDAEAQSIARTGFLTGGAGAFADEAIGRIGEMRRMGSAGSLGPMEQSLVIRQGAPSTYPQAEEIVDGTGRVVGYADPNTKVPIALDPELGISIATQGANTPDTAQLINAPQNPQTAREWAASNLPAMTQDTGSTPPRYPQANISKETTDFSNRVRNVLASMELPNAPTVSDNVRNIEEIEGVAKFIQKELEKRGDTLMIRNPDETSRTKNIPAGTQVVSGLMQKLGMTSGDEERLANAMFQLDAAKTFLRQPEPHWYLPVPYREPTKDVIFNAPPEGFKEACPLLSKVAAPASVLVLTPKVRQSNKTSVLPWLDWTHSVEALVHRNRLSECLLTDRRSPLHVDLWTQPCSKSLCTTALDKPTLQLSAQRLKL